LSTVIEEPRKQPAPQAVGPRADTLAASVLIMLGMTVAQRLIGLGRGVMFCRWLDPEQLGKWDVAFGFLNLAAPLVVLGLPGSFGRYAEYFRARGQFRTFLRRTSLVSMVMCVVATAVMIVQRAWFSQLIFGTPDESEVVVWLALCLAMVVMHNLLTALFIAVRMYRFVTVLQFVQSVGFAILSLGLVLAWQLGASGIVIGYGVATVVSALGAFAWLRDLSRSEQDAGIAVPHGTFWAKLLPFAIWMWMTNLLANLFEVIDRYMIIHHSGLDAHEALRQVGFYHSSRIIPLLFVAIAGLLGSMITPHLSQDWEAQRRDAVIRRLNFVLKTMALTLFAISVCVLAVAPVLFQVAFQNKFGGGLHVLPWTLTYCAWFGILAVAQNYLWCAERPGLASFSLLAGLLLNISLNSVLLPRYGLSGAVWATTAANCTSLLLTFWLSTREGMQFDRGTWLLVAAPASLGCGLGWAAGLLAALLIAVLSTDRVFTRSEKQHVGDLLRQGRHKINSALGTLRRVRTEPPAGKLSLSSPDVY